MTACDQLSSGRSPWGVFEGGICISLNSGQVGRVTAIHGLKDRIECSKLVNSVVDQRASSERARAGRGGGGERRRRARCMHTKEGTHKHAATKKGNTARKKKKRGPETRENRRVNDSKPSTPAIWESLTLGL